MVMSVVFLSRFQYPICYKHDKSAFSENNQIVQSKYKRKTTDGTRQSGHCTKVVFKNRFKAFDLYNRYFGLVI